MKVGIITHWNAPNYGSFLQAYALRNVISSLLPDDQVELVNYIKPIHLKMYYSLEVHELYRLWFINPHFYSDVIKRIRQYKEIEKRRYFKEYYKLAIPHSEKPLRGDIERMKYDVIVLGSDILWDYSISYFGNDPVMFGLNTTSQKKISYAASFGTVKRHMKHPNYVKEGIQQLSHISVRDENSALLVKEISGEMPDVVLDPTLLWDFKKDENIIVPHSKGDYMVVYGTDFTDLQINEAIQFAKEYKLRIVSIEGERGNIPWADEELEMKELSPFQWAGYIKNAYLIMTCTFHGLMFGLIYNKRMFFYATSFMRDKAESLLKKYGLDIVLLYDKSFQEQATYNWEEVYYFINKKIKEDRKRSIDYLKEALQK